MSAVPDTGHAVSGKKVAIAMFFILLSIALATYFVVPMMVTPYFTAKPRQTRELFSRLSAALVAYHSDHGAFPSEDDLIHYRKMTKNVAKSHAVGMSTYRAAQLTTPTAYINPAVIADPYAMPDQYAPPAYIRGSFGNGSAEFAILCSPGPNLLYEIRPPDFRTIANRESLVRMLVAHQYDPTNGIRSHGDFYEALIATADSPVDRLGGVSVQ